MSDEIPLAPDLEAPGTDAESSQVTGTPASAGPDAAKPRRFLPLLAAIAGVVVLVLIGGLLWVRYTQSPRYSLAQLATVVQGKDWDGVQGYVDVDAVAAQFVDAALSNAGSGESADDDSVDDGSAMGGSTGMGAGSGGPGGTQGMKPVFVQRFRDALKENVEGATLKQDAGGVSAVLLGTKPKNVKYVSEQEAEVTVEVPTGTGGTQDITLRMQKIGDQWRITAFEGIDDLMGSLN